MENGNRTDREKVIQSSLAGGKPSKLGPSTLLLGLVLTLFGLGSGHMIWKDVQYCYEVLSDGTETTAIVIKRNTTVRISGRRKRKARERYSVLQYDGYRGLVPFWVEQDVIPVIYPKTYGQPMHDITSRDSMEGVTSQVRKIDHRQVIIGKKSDGFFTLFRRNFILTSAVFWTAAFLFLTTFGLLAIGAWLWDSLRHKSPTNV